MRKSVAVILLAFFSTVFCFSQDSIDDPNTEHTQTGQHTVYTELLGNAGLLYSIGYDYTIKLKGKEKLSFNCGFQYFYGMYSLSPQINYLQGKKKNHYRDLGIGVICSNELTAILFRIGYRYQREDGGFFFKIAYTPAFTDFQLLSRKEWRLMPIWGGVAFGYTFKNKETIVRYKI